MSAVAPSSRASISTDRGTVLSEDSHFSTRWFLRAGYALRSRVGVTARLAIEWPTFHRLAVLLIPCHSFELLVSQTVGTQLECLCFLMAVGR